jgi:hypothetical protein
MTRDQRRFDAAPAGRFAVAVFRAAGFLAARSGSFLLPVWRFHSSNVSAEILPSTSNSANFRLCAWLLNGNYVASSSCAGQPVAAGGPEREE